MPSGKKSLVESDFLSKERNALAEERTFLAYIRTEFAFLGVIALVFRFYLYEYSWGLPAVVFIFVIVGLLIIYEIFMIKRLRKNRHRLQKKHVHFKSY